MHIGHVAHPSSAEPADSGSRQNRSRTVAATAGCRHPLIAARAFEGRTFYQVASGVLTPKLSKRAGEWSRWRVGVLAECRSVASTVASVIFSFRKIGLSDRCAAATEATASRATPAELTLNCFDKLRVEAGCSEAIMLLNEIKDDLSRLAGFCVRVFSRASLRRWHIRNSRKARIPVPSWRRYRG